MSRKPNGNGVIEPQLAYTLEAAARELGVGTGWLRDNLLNSGGVPHVRLNQGKYIFVRGQDIIDWIDRIKN